MGLLACYEAYHRSAATTLEYEAESEPSIEAINNMERRHKSHLAKIALACTLRVRLQRLHLVRRQVQ